MRGAALQGKDLFMDLDAENLTLTDPQDLSLLNVQPVQSIRVWGVGRDNGRYVLEPLLTREPQLEVEFGAEASASAKMQR